MDVETGESYPDKETGEMPPEGTVNLETGECEINHTMPQKESKKSFRVPHQNPNKNLIPLAEVHPSEIPEKSFCVSDIVPCVLFLLPTTLCFYPVIAVLLSLIEVALHIWAHKKNKTQTSKEVRYRSPLHIIVREFCGSCKEERALNKISMIQDKRNYKFIKYGIDYVHGIVM